MTASSTPHRSLPPTVVVLLRSALCDGDGLRKNDGLEYVVLLLAILRFGRVARRARFVFRMELAQEDARGEEHGEGENEEVRRACVRGEGGKGRRRERRPGNARRFARSGHRVRCGVGEAGAATLLASPA